MCFKHCWKQDFRILFCNCSLLDWQLVWFSPLLHSAQHQSAPGCSGRAELLKLRVFDLYMPHQRFCFMLVSRLQGLKWGSSKWTFASSPEVESCCSTAGISYEVLPPDWNMEFCLFGFFLRSRAKLYPKDTCIIHWVLSVQLPVCYKGKGLFVQSPVALRVSPRDPLQPDALIYYPYFIFFKNLFILQYIKVFHLLKSTNKHNYFYYYTTFYSVLAAAQLKLH